MLFEDGSIRYISAGKDEILRMIYAAVRDKEWLTIKPTITKERIERYSDSFKIQYTCSYKPAGIDFNADFTIEGKSDNTIIFTLEGKALGSFEKNRIGFCVLHPVEGCSGQECVITHSNGETGTYNFPDYISPHQPFRDIKIMQWETSGTKFILEFSGDIFETEDQRNWCDASYKTYSTPLDKPFPVKIEKGETISQQIIFKTAYSVRTDETTDNHISATVHPGVLISLPRIGIGRSSRNVPLNENEISILKDLRFDHYRADLYLFDPQWKYIADLACREALSLGYAMESALFFDADFRSQTEDFIRWITECECPTAVINLYHRTEPVMSSGITEFISNAIRIRMPSVQICCGTNANFAQFNSNRPVSDTCDFMCYSVHPQEHASDNTTVVENLNAISYTAESARNLSAGKGIWISPVNLQRRFNANIENFEHQIKDNSIPPQVDSRIMSLFGACWTAGSLKNICESGVRGVTYYETVGERGIIQGDYPSRWSDEIKTHAGMIFPAAFVFKFLLEDKSLRVIKSTCSHPLKSGSLVLSDGIRTRIIIMNYLPGPQVLSIRGISGMAGLIQLHTSNFAEATADINWLNNTAVTKISLNNGLLMEPYSISFINTGWIDDDI